MMRTSQKRRRHLVPLLLATGGLMAACVEGDDLMEMEESTSRALSIQDAITQLYDIDNVLKVDINMNGDAWGQLLDEEPNFGVCVPAPVPYSQFDEYPNVQVTISGSKYPTTPQTYSGVTIRKKSYCGSFSQSKPSLKLEFGDEAEGVLGTTHLTLNNSEQDTQSYVRQTLGYYLFRQAGLPASRANYAQVRVNGTKIKNGIYINVEPVRKPFLANPDNEFTQKTGGNGLYEFAWQDFHDASLNPVDYIGIESASPYDECYWGQSGEWKCEEGYQTDLTVAIDQIKTGISGLAKVVDVDQFIKAYAMEFMLKHWDGYASSRNNTYFYNDAPKTRTPKANGKDIRFKYIPSGIDQILQPVSYDPEHPEDRYFRLDAVGSIARLVRNDSTSRTKLFNQIKTYRNTVFSRAKIEGDIKAHLNKCKARLSSLGFDATAGIAEIVDQLELARSASYLLVGPTSSEGLYVVDKTTGDVLHPSSVLTVGGTSTDFEALHQGWADTSADRWYFTSGRVVNESSGRRLHCAQASTTSGGHRYIYVTSRSASNNEQTFSLVPEKANSYAFSGYFKMNCYYGASVFFGNDDPASDGRQRVYQRGGSSNAWLSWY